MKEDEEQRRRKPATLLALFKPAVINDRAHTEPPPADPCEAAAQTGFGVVTFPKLLIDERLLSHHKLW